MAGLAAWGSLLQGAGALVAAIVALVAVYFSHKITQQSLAAQREQNLQMLDVQERTSRSEVIWSHRIAAYEEALTWLRPILSSLSGELSDRSPVLAPDAFAQGEALPPELDAKLWLYAPGPALSAVAALRAPIAFTKDVVAQLSLLETALRDHVDRSTERRLSRP